MKRFPLAVAGLLLLALAAAPAASADDVQVHGLLSQTYLDSTDNDMYAKTKDGTLKTREYIVNFQKRHSPKFRLGAQVLSRQLGDDGDMDPVLDWAYGDYKFHDNFGIRFGRIKIPGGLHNQVRDIDIVRPTAFLPLTTYLEDARQIVCALNGAGLYGTLDIGSAGALDLQCLVGTNQMDADTGYVKEVNYTLSGSAARTIAARIQAAVAGGALTPAQGAALAANLRANMPSVGDDRSANMGNMLAWHIQWRPPVDGLRLVFSHGQTKIDYTGHFVTGLPAGLGLPTTLDLRSEFNFKNYDIASIEYQKRNWTLTYELMRPKSEVTVAGSAPVKRDYEGSYAQVAYRFNRRFEAAVTSGKFYKDINDRDGANYVALGLPAHYAWQKDDSLSLRYDIDSRKSFKLEYHKMDGAGLCHVFENPTGMKKDWNLLVAKATYNF